MLRSEVKGHMLTMVSQARVSFTALRKFLKRKLWKPGRGDGTTSKVLAIQA